VLVVTEPGRAAAAALRVARRLVEQEHASLTVVSLAPQVTNSHGCAGSVVPYNRAVCQTAAHELEQAREELGEAAAHSTFRVLVEGVDPPLVRWCEEAGFNLILLPARRRPLRALKHPLAARLRQTGARVQVVRP
jgi:K+-sensing histidine kinase KdpD